MRQEIRKINKEYGMYLDPIMIVILFILLIIPVVAISNLSPNVIQNDNRNKNVLGATTDTGISVVKVGGSHNIITNEQLDRTYKDRYQYTATLNQHETGKYSKPILRIYNDSETNVTITTSMVKQESSTSEIGLLLGDTNYIMVDKTGQIFPREITLEAREEKELYITINSSNSLNFAQTIQLEIASADFK